MALKVKWSAKAIQSFEKILIYLIENWSVKEVNAFITRTNNLLEIVATHPYAFKASKHKKIRKAVIGKQNSLFYIIKNDQIYLAFFWDNRMDPDKNRL